MTTLVKRLRNGAAPLDDPDLNDEAADEIERLTNNADNMRQQIDDQASEIERLRAARKPLTQAQVDALLHASRDADEGPTALIRRVERARGIGSDE